MAESGSSEETEMSQNFAALIEEINLLRTENQQLRKAALAWQPAAIDRIFSGILGEEGRADEAIAESIAKERERCAQIADTLDWGTCQHVAHEIATAIRSQIGFANPGARCPPI